MKSGCVLICLSALSACSGAFHGVSDSDVHFHFYSTSNSEGILTNISDPEDVARTNFSSSKDTFFLIHGWLDKEKSPRCQMLKDVLLELYDINVFILDWDKIANNVLYPVAFSKVKPVGEVMGGMMQDMVERSGLDLNRTVIVGHSLGAHIGGVAGKVLEGKLNHIIGLDPAAPLFVSHITDNRITTESAQFVQIIHTNGGLLGYFDPLGHADYYPNGGKAQPMCHLDIFGQCAHLKGYDYLADSFQNGNITARKCESHKDFKKGKCEDGDVSFLGQYDIDRSASGTYFLDTNEEPPYGKQLVNDNFL